MPPVETPRSQYVLGDVDIPAETHVLRDVVATGTLRLGDGCVCEGSLIGGRGVTIGRRVVVKGDVVSSGPVTIGPGAEVQGHVRSLDPPHRVEDDRPDAVELLPPTIHATTGMLLDVAWDAHRRGVAEGVNDWWGVEWPAVEATVDGLRGLLAETYRGGNGTIPWAADEVFDVLLARVVGAIVPVSVTRKGEEYALVTLGAPAGASDATVGWPRPVLSLVGLLGKAVHPDFRVALADERHHLEPDADPERVHAVVSVRPRASASSEPA